MALTPHIESPHSGPILPIGGLSNSKVNLLQWLVLAVERANVASDKSVRM